MRLRTKTGGGGGVFSLTPRKRAGVRGNAPKQPRPAIRANWRGSMVGEPNAREAGELEFRLRRRRERERSEEGEERLHV